MNFYFEVIHHPERHFSFENKATFKPLGLSECNCSSFSRLNNNRRSRFESAIVNHLDKTVSKEIPVQLLILGAGELLDTWVLIGKLMQRTFRLFELYLIDPKINSSSVQSFQSFYAQFPNVKLSCYPLRSIHDLPSSKRFHSICAIDFDEMSYIDTLNDFNKSFLHLAENGKLFFDYANSDFVCSRKGIEEILQSDNLEIMKDVKAIIPSNTENLCIFAHRQTLDTLICIIKILKDNRIRDMKIYYDPQPYEFSLKTNFVKIFYPQLPSWRSMEERNVNLAPDLVLSCYEDQLYGEIWSREGKTDLLNPNLGFGKIRKKYHRTVTNYLIAKDKTYILRL